MIWYDASGDSFLIFFYFFSFMEILEKVYSGCNVMFILLANVAFTCKNVMKPKKKSVWSCSTYAKIKLHQTIQMLTRWLSVD